MDEEQVGRRRDGAAGGRGQNPAGPRSAPDQHLDVEAFSAYLDGRLDPAERRAADAHLAGCADCRHELAGLRATVALLRGLPQYAPRRSFRLGPEHAVLPQTGGRLVRLLPALPALRAATAAVAAALLLVLGGDLIVNLDDQNLAYESAPALVVPAPDADEAVVEETAPGAEKAAEEEQAPAAEAPPADQDAGAERAARQAPAAAPRPEEGTEAAGATSNQMSEASQDAAADGLPPAAAPTPPPLAAAIAATASAGGVSVSADSDASFATQDEASPEARPRAPALAPAATGAAAARDAGAGEGGGSTADGSIGRAGTDADDGNRPSAWRIAEVGLGLLLLWLIVGVVALQQLRRRLA